MAGGRTGRNNEMVITVGLQASEGNTKAVFDLTAKNAQKLGKAISDAIAFDKRSVETGFNAVNESLKKLATSAGGVRTGLKAMANFPYRQTVQNIGSIDKQLKTLTTTSVNAGKAIKDIKFVIGDTNRNIKSVVTQLEKLETVAKRIGTVNVGVNNTGTRGTSASSTTAQRYSTPAGPPNPPTFSSSNTNSSGGLSYGPLTGFSQKDLDSYKKQREQFLAYDKAVNQKVVQNAAQTGEAAKKGFISGLSGIRESVASLANDSKSRFSQIFAANFFAGLAYNAVSSFLRGLKDLATETIVYAARTQELGVVLRSLAQQNGISTQTIVEQETAIKSLNITTQDARETLARFINVGFSLQKAGPLARVAQDLAVISGVSSSEELNKLIVGIQTLQSRNLRTAGVFLTVDEVLDKLSGTTGRARDSFSTLEKQQAVLNAVMDYGSKVAGSYNAAMTTASKQMRSLERQAYEAQNALGEAFIPALSVAVETTGSFLEIVAKYPDIFTRAITVVGLFTASLIALKTQAIQGAVSGIAGVIGSAAGYKTELTGQQALLAEKRAELLVERESIQNGVVAYDNMLAKIEAQQTLNLGKTEQLTIERDILIEQAAQNRTALAQNTVQRFGAGAASVLGKLTGILAVAAIVYEVGKSIYDIYNAPLDLKNVDTNIASKYRDDLERYQKLKEQYTEIGQVSNSQVDADQQKLDIAKQLGAEGKAYLNILNQQKEVSGDIGKALDYQIQSIQSKIDSQLSVARTNVYSAITNEGRVQGNTDANSARLRQLQDFVTSARKAGAELYSSADVEGTYFKGLYSSANSDALKRNIDLINNGGEQLAIHMGSISDNAKTAQIEIASLSDKINVSSEQLAKDQITSQQKLQELVQLSETYGINVDDQVNMVIDSLGREGGNVDLLRDKYEALKKARNEAFAAQIDIQAQSPEGRIDTLYGELAKKQAEAIDREKSALLQQVHALGSQGDAGIPELQKYTPEYIKRRLELAQKSATTNFGFGEAGKENNAIFLSSISDRIYKEQQDRGSAYSAPDLVKRTFDLLNENSGNSEKFNILHQIFGDRDEQNDTLHNVTEIIDKYQELIKAKDLESATKLHILFGQSDEERKKIFDSESVAQQVGTIERIQRLTYQLTGRASFNVNQADTPEKAERLLKTLEKQKKIRDDITEARLRLRELAEGPNSELESLQRQVKIEEAIYAYKNKQKDVEDEISILKQTNTLPLVNTELLLQKSILEQVEKRRDAEQQLTVDIAVEIDKRRRYSLNSPAERNRLGAETFLGLQQDERTSQENLIKAQYTAAFNSGNVSQFADNPIIQEAVKQSEHLAEVEKQGGLQVVTIKETNDILTRTQNITQESNAQLSAISSTLSSKLQAIYDKITPPTGADGVPIYGDTVTPSLRGSLTTTQRGLVKLVGDRFSANGFTPQAIEAMLANIGRENSFNTDTIFKGHYDPKNHARNIGLISFQGGRYNQLMNYLNDKGLYKVGTGIVRDDASILAMVDFISQEIGGYKAGKLVRNKSASRAQIFQALTDRGGYIGDDPNFGKNRADAEFGSLANRQWAARLGLTIPATRAVVSAITGKASPAGGVLPTYQSQALTEFTKQYLDPFEHNKEIYSGILKVLNDTRVIESNRSKTLDAYYQEKREQNISEAGQLDQLTILGDRVSNLDVAGSYERRKVEGEAEIERAQRIYNLKADTIKLEAEEQYRARYKDTAYYNEQLIKFNNDQLQQKQQLQDANTQLYISEQEYLKENSQLRANIIAQEQQQRKEEAFNLTKQIDAQKRYNDDYLLSAENRKRIDNEENVSRLKAHQDLVEALIKMDADAGHQEDDLDLRLTLKRRQIEQDRLKEHDDFLTKQIELEDAYNRKLTDKVNPDDLRNRVLDKIVSSTKSTTDVLSELWTDSFDAISGGFGSLVDKMTKRLGIFGGVTGNFLKNIFNNVLGTLYKNIIDVITPSSVKDKGYDVLGSIVSTATGGAVGGASAGGAQGVAAAQTSVAAASNTAAANIIFLAQAAAAAANALIGIAGGVGATAAGVASSLSPLLRGGAGGGAGASTNGNAIINNIAQITNAGQASVGSVTNDLDNVLASAGAAGYGISGGGVTGGGTTSAIGTLAHEGIHAVTSKAASGARGLLSGLSLKGIGTQLLQAAPALGASFGGLLGGQSAVGQGLGQIGGGIAGVLGGSLGLALLGGTSLTTALGSADVAGSIGILGLSGAATLGIGAAVAGAFLLASYLFGRSKRRKVEKQNVAKWSSDAVTQMQDLLKAVQSDKTDGAQALATADDIISQFQQNIATLKTKPGKQQAQQQLAQLQSLRTQISNAANAQTVRQELDSKIVPTYATGGIASSSLIAVSKGEKLYPPSSRSYMSGAFGAAGIPGFAGGGVTLPGTYDGRDNILTRVPVGTVIATPAQQARLGVMGFASGGVVRGTRVAPAAQAAVVQTPPATVIVVFTPEEAEALGRQIPNSVIVGKVRRHVKDTRTSGLAGDVLNAIQRG